MKRKKQHAGVLDIRATSGAARRAHFAAGGTLAMWRGSAHTFADRKKREDRRACRGQF